GQPLAALPGLRYELYLTGGLDASGFTADAALVGGRGNGREAHTEDPAVSGRVAYSLPGGEVGAGAYFGKAGQNNPALDKVRVTVAEIDARYQHRGLELRAEYAAAFIVNSWQVNRALML